MQDKKQLFITHTPTDLIPAQNTFILPDIKKNRIETELEERNSKNPIDNILDQKKPLGIYIESFCINNPHLIPMALDKKWITEDRASELVIKAIVQTITKSQNNNWQFDSNNHLEPALLLALSRVARHKDLLIDLNIDRNGLDHNAYSITLGLSMITPIIWGSLVMICTCGTLGISMGVPVLAMLLFLICESLKKDVRTLIKAPKEEKRIVSELQSAGLFRQKSAPAPKMNDATPAPLQETSV